MKGIFALSLVFLLGLSSLSFADMSGTLQPGECWELIPGHRACCGDNKCSADALETCSVCPQDCFCAPNFECNPLMRDENGRDITDERGCYPAGFNAQPPDNDGRPPEPGPCAGAFILVGLATLAAFAAPRKGV